jgi:hypothetical protein
MFGHHPIAPDPGHQRLIDTPDDRMRITMPPPPWQSHTTSMQKTKTAYKTAERERSFLPHDP